MLEIAILMLMRDKGKSFLLISGLAFSSLLISLNTSVFCGYMLQTVSMIRNIHTEIWVTDPHVEQVNVVQSLKDTDVDLVRSVEGVEWAVPFYWGIIDIHTADGRFFPQLLLGLDEGSLIGRPSEMKTGSCENLAQPNTVVMDEFGAGQVGNIQIGSTFSINDHEVQVAGVCKASRHFFNYPYLYTTYQRALEYAPPQRKMLSYVLVKPKSGVNVDELVQRINQQTGLMAHTEDSIFWKTIWWYFRKTGIPESVGVSVILAFLVGLTVSGQTFYTFILENMRYLAALKAMGTSTLTLTRMLLLQSFLVGWIGCGIGIGLTALFGYMVVDRHSPPFHLPYQVLIITFLSGMSICAFSAWIGIRKVQQAEPASVFR